MLVLSRKLGESIFIGKDVEVVLIDVNGWQGSARFLVESGDACLKTTLGLRRDGLPKFVWLSDVTKLTLLEVTEGGKVRVGIDSPRSVKIWRGEIKPLREDVADKNGGNLNGVGEPTAKSPPVGGVDKRVVEAGKPACIDGDSQKGKQDARDQEATDEFDPDLAV